MPGEAECSLGCDRTYEPVTDEVARDLDRIGAAELGLTVGILNPQRYPSRVLLQHATFMKPIRKGALAASQLPNPLHDQASEIHEPGSW